MATQLIEFQDGPLVEVETSDDQMREVAGRFSQQVETTFEKISDLLVTTCRPIVLACEELGQTADIDGAEVELGLSFESEGNLYITKAKAGANLTVKLLLKPKPVKTHHVSDTH
ncbi:MAG: CU044_2847 family protein [Cyanobacteria bacterium J06648_10]